MFEFEKPKIEIVEISDDNKYGKFVVEPLERGYGLSSTKEKKSLIRRYRVRWQ